MTYIQTLFNKLFKKSIEQLNLFWAPTNKMLFDYEKIKKNYKLYNKNNKDIFDILNSINKYIQDRKKMKAISIVVSENLKEDIVNYIIIKNLMELCDRFAKDKYFSLNLVEYHTWLSTLPTFSNNKIFIIDLRNLYLKKENEQEIFITKLIELINKRKGSNLYSIVILDDSLKEIIYPNQYIKNFFENTIIIK